MSVVVEIQKSLKENWIPKIYEQKIRSQRTRSHQLDIPEKENRAIIQHTLLGVELKVRNKRFSCPDLSTARYLQVFARLGCQEIAIPYDISRISNLADELDSSWHKMLLLVEKETLQKTPAVRGRLRAGLIRQIRNEIDKIGAGELMPKFKKSTKQRPN
jgi:hypothetical protein